MQLSKAKGMKSDTWQWQHYMIMIYYKKLYISLHDNISRRNSFTYKFSYFYFVDVDLPRLFLKVRCHHNYVQNKW